jgi:hypothetical protein
MWAGSDVAVSPRTRARIIAADNQWLLGGGTRRYAGRSNASNVERLLIEPGAAPIISAAAASGSAAPDVRPPSPRRLRPAPHSNAHANSAEFAATSVGMSTVGARLSEHAADHARGVRQIRSGHGSHLENYGYTVRASPARERVPPPPLPQRTAKPHLKRVESAVRSDSASEAWADWSTVHRIPRTSGPRMFPEKLTQETAACGSGGTGGVASGGGAFFGTDASIEAIVAARRRAPAAAAATARIADSPVRQAISDESWDVPRRGSGEAALERATMPSTAEGKPSSWTAVPLTARAATASYQALSVRRQAQLAAHVKSGAGGVAAAAAAEVGLRYVPRKKGVGSAATPKK